jgi:hypothetical protein
MASVSKFLYRNGTETVQDLHIEPDGEHYLVRPGESVDIVVDYLREGTLELEQVPGGLLIWGYESSIVYVMSEGKELDPFFPE